MRRDDLVRLRHMLDSARDALAFTTGRSRADLDADRMLALSVVKCIEIVGEAASRVLPDTRERIPGIPWQDIIGMRNRLIHAYYDIDLDRVWDTVVDDLPALVAELESALPADGV